MRARSRLGLILAVSLGLPVAASAQSSALDGRWSLNLAAAEGEHSFTIELSVDGTEVSGVAGDETFTGTFKDGTLTLSGEHYVPEVGYAAVLDIEARLDGDRLRGSATWDVYQATLNGRRIE